MSVAYPVAKMARSTDLTPQPSAVVDLSTDGTPRGREVVAQATVQDGRIEHLLMTTAEKDALLSFWSTNKNEVVTLTWAGQDYELMMLGRPNVRKQNGAGTWWQASVSVSGRLV